MFEFLAGLVLGAIFSKPLYMLFAWVMKKIGEIKKE